MKKTTYKKGLRAERLCRIILRLKFYRVLATRYKTPVGEIDIVAAKGKTLIAVEVKSRATCKAAAESVTRRQQQRIVHTLEYFILTNPRYATASFRFDVMLVQPKRWPIHIRNAWMEE